MRVRVISNVTMDLLKAYVPDHELAFPGVGAWPAALIEAGEADVDAVIIHVDVGALRSGDGGTDRVDYIASLVRDWVQANQGVPVLLNTALCQPCTAFSFADPTRASGVVGDVGRWNAAMGAVAQDAPFAVLVNLDIVLSTNPLNAVVASRYWYHGRIRYSAAGFQALGSLYGDVLNALVVAPRKVAVVDLDNTLWGGVFGDEGARGVTLGEDGVGRCFRDFQFALRDLRDAGVLLAVLSKNDPGVVDEVAANNPMQVLRPDDFADIDLGWEPKPVRLAAMAERLGLGLDAFVFIDDSEFERGAMAESLPEVAVPPFPAKPEDLPSWLLDEVVPTYFARATLSDEDAARTSHYRARRARETSGDLSDFIGGLGIDLRYRVDDIQQLARVSQLTQKTNQFNLTTERLSPRELAMLVESDDGRVITLEYADRFGHEGVVGVAVLDVRAGRLTNLLLSCRVLGRGVESRFLAEVERMAREAGVAVLHARYIRSDRNAVASGFLAENGYQGEADDHGWHGRKEIT